MSDEEDEDDGLISSAATSFSLSSQTNLSLQHDSVWLKTLIFEVFQTVLNLD